MLYDAVVFDLDGTLIKSEDGIINSTRQALERLGVSTREYSQEYMHRVIGPPLHQTMSEIFGLPEDEAKLGVKYYRECYAHHGIYQAEVYSGIPMLLRGLKARGVHIGLATGKPEQYARKILKHFCLYEYFDEIYGVRLDELTQDKPGMIAAALPEKYSRAIMVGDTMYDICGGAAVGIETAAVTYGYGDTNELLAQQPDHVCNSVQQLSELLQPIKLKGAFFTLEGGDGAGKTTQAKALIENMRRLGWDAIYTREPGGNAIAESIRNILLDRANSDMDYKCEALLYSAARAQHLRDIIHPALDAGKIVICDRYIDSSAAYQGAGRGLGIDEVNKINAFATSGCMPDQTFILALEVDQAQKRMQNKLPDRLESEGGRLQQKVLNGFYVQASKYPERICVLSAHGGIDDIAQHIWDIAAAYMRYILPYRKDVLFKREEMPCG